MQCMTAKQRKEAAAYQFELQASKLDFTIMQKLTNFRYVLNDNHSSAVLTAMVLPEAFDYYEYRLNRGKRRIDLLIVQHHNAVVPIPLIDMSDNKLHDEAKTPEVQRGSAKRRNKNETALIVSQLVLGTKAAEDIINAMPLRMRQRYIQKRDEYLKPRIGRPWAS